MTGGKEILVRQWLMRTARQLLVLPEGEFSERSVCFHAQQMAEKTLKAYLVAQDAPFPKTHEIETLIGLCARVDPDFASVDAGLLSDYAVEVRYPDGASFPDAAEAREAWRTASVIRELVWRMLGITEQDIAGWRNEMKEEEP